MVTWQPLAQAHLRNIYRHIAKDSVNTARRILYQIRQRNVYVIAAPHRRQQFAFEDIQALRS